MPFAQPNSTIKLEPPTTLPGISAGDWLEIRTVNTAGMRQRLFQRAFNVRIDGQQVVSDHMDMFAYRQALLEEIVVAWSDPQPVTPAGLAEISPEVADWIAAEFDARVSQPRPEAEKKDLSSPSSHTSGPDTESSPASSATS